jgi:nucleotide-binding universal stress UspA family protein
MESDIIKLPRVDVKNILYTTDLSANARYAFAYAVSLANLYRARLTILHVIPEDENLEAKLTGYVDTDKLREIKKQQLQEARATLIGKQSGLAAIRSALYNFCDQAVSDLGAQDVKTDEILVESGHPVEIIVSVAEEKDCDLIVLGSHGYGILKGALMGGTARGVIRRTKKPVLLVRLPEEDD